MNVALFLTYARIGFIPIFVIVFYLPFHWSHLACAIIFALAAITDWLDGFLARQLKQTSKLGEFLDPVADKLMVAVALILVLSEPHLPYLTIPGAIIIGREIVVSALREWMAEIGKRASVAVSYIAKIKTALQMVSLILLLLYVPDHSSLVILRLGYIFIYSAALLTLWTMVLYLKASWKNLV